MADEEKISYSDIIQSDDSLDKLIDKLDEINTSYAVIVDTIKDGAAKVAKALKTVSGATEEGRKTIDDAAIAADRLKRAQKELAFAASETGQKVAWLKAQTSELNRSSVDTNRALVSALGSYTELSAKLSIAVNAYKKLSKEQRTNTEEGHSLLNYIIDLKTQMGQVDKEMRVVIESSTLLEKAEKRLAYLNSEEGKQYLELRKQINALTRARKEGTASLSEEGQLKQRLAFLNTEEGKRVLDLRQQINELAKARREQGKATTELERLQERLAFLNTEEGRNTVELRQQISDLISTYKKLASGKRELTAEEKAYNAAQEALAVSLSTAGQEAAKARAEAEANNKASVEAYKLMKSAKGSYDELSVSLKMATDEYKAMSTAARQTPYGQDLLNNIINMKARLAELNKIISEGVKAKENDEKINNTAADSYDGLKLRLAQAVEYYKSLTEAQRGNDSEGKVALSTIASLSEKLREIEKALKDATTATADTSTVAPLAADSYKAIKDELSKAIDTFKSMSEAQRNNAAEGGALLTRIAELKNQIAEYDKAMQGLNRTSELNAEFNNAAEGSYNKLNAELKLAIDNYKAMSETERSGNTGQDLINRIDELKKKLAELDAQIKTTRTTTSSTTSSNAAVSSSIEGLTRDLNDMVKAYNRLSSVERAGARGQTMAVRISEMRRKLKELNDEQKTAKRLSELNAIVNTAAAGSYNQLAAQYEINKIQLNAMSDAERNGTEAGKELERQTASIYKKMVQLQEATGNYRLSVGHYTKVWDKLGFSIFQVVRELPAAAVSLNTLFLAMSNNIPMVIDEINKLRKANEELRAEGKPTVNIIGRIVKAVLSWNTALVVALSVFSAHGEAILKWIDRVLAGRSTALDMTEALETLNEELGKNAKSYGAEATILRRLSDEWKRLGDSVQKQQQFIKDNQNEFSKLDISITDVNTASKVFVDNTDDVIEALKARAKAQAALNILSEKTGELLKLENKREAEAVKQYGFFEKSINFFKAFAAGFYGPDKDLSFGARLSTQRQRNIKAIKEDEDDLQTTIDSYFKVYQFYIDKQQEIYDRLNLEPTHKKESSRTRTPRDPEDTLESLSLAATKAYQKSVTELERGAIVKRRKEYLAAYNTEIADLNVKYNKIRRILEGYDDRYKELTEEQKEQALKAQDEILRAIENKQKEAEFGISMLTYEEQEQAANTQLATLNLQIDAVKKGSEEELKLRLQILQVEEQIALARNKQLPPSQQQEESAIKAGFKKKRTEIVTNYNVSDFDQQQKLEEAKFNAVKQSENAITKFKLQQERDRWNFQIQLAKAGALEWSDAQIEAAEATVRGINRQIAEVDDIFANIGKKGLGFTLLEQLGFDEDQIDAISEATSIVVDSLQEIMDKEVELAEAAVEAAEKRVEAAQKAYDAEIEARNNGYANNVSTARKELDEEKRKQLERQKILAEAQRKQEALNSIAQASNLVTASSLIWSQLGFPFAIPAIAVMWASFAAAKIKANQVTKQIQETETYGEGGIEFLEGGSHASGNDIDLGTTNSKGRRMRAEGGEALAIINRRQTRRYKKLLPDVIDSFNKGVFEDKYTKAFSQGDNINMLIASNDTARVDLSILEREVGAIRKQNESSSYVLPDGTIVIQKKNIKRIIRN